MYYACIIYNYIQSKIIYGTFIDKAKIKYVCFW